LVPTRSLRPYSLYVRPISFRRSVLGCCANRAGSRESTCVSNSTYSKPRIHATSRFRSHSHSTRSIPNFFQTRFDFLKVTAITCRTYTLPSRSQPTFTRVSILCRRVICDPFPAPSFRHSRPDPRDCLALHSMPIRLHAFVLSHCMIAITVPHFLIASSPSR
jgi:hypothetical protein